MLCGSAKIPSEFWRISQSPPRVGQTWRSQSARWSCQRLLLPLPPSSLGHLACFSFKCPLHCPLIGQGFSFGPLLLKSQDGILIFLYLALCPRVQRLRAAILCPSLRRQPSPQLQLRICPAFARLHAISLRRSEQFPLARGEAAW